MKNITKLLRRSNLSGKERAIAIIHNDIEYLSHGNYMLSKSEIEELRAGTPSEDASAYNKYIEMWNEFNELIKYMHTVALTTFLEIGYIEKILLMYALGNGLSRGADTLNEAELQEANVYLLERTGIEYDRLVHELAFKSLPQETQDDLALLHPEVQYDGSYLAEEEQLANILQDKSKLNEDDAIALVDLIMNSMLFDAPLYDKVNKGTIIFSCYFAGIPMMLFGEKLAKRHHLSYKSEDELKEKLGDLPNLEQELRNTIRDSITSGLFTQEYIPLCNSNGRETYEGATKIKHKELFAKWVQAKAIVVAELDTYITNGELVVEIRDLEPLSSRSEAKVITGHSLFTADELLPFVQDYKTHIYNLTMYGYVMSLARKRDLSDYCGNLLAYDEMSQKMSGLVGKDMPPTSKQYLKEFYEKVSFLNMTLTVLRDKVGEIVHGNTDTDFSIVTYFHDDVFDYSGQESTVNQGLQRFKEVVKKSLSKEW